MVEDGVGAGLVLWGALATVGFVAEVARGARERRRRRPTIEVVNVVQAPRRGGAVLDIRLRASR